MRQKHILTALAIFAVTGALNFPSRSAGAWWVDGIQSLADPKPWIDHRLMDLGQPVWDAFIHTVDREGSGIPLNDQYSYESQWRQPEHGAPQDTRSGHKTDSRVGPSNNYLQKESSGSPPKESSGSRSSPYPGAMYGGVPTTPSADPLVRELNRDPSIR